VRAAAAQAPPYFTVDDAVAQAIKNNPRLSAAARDVVAARSGVRSASAIANPEIVFSPAISVGGSDEELIVRQPLEINGTRAARTGVANAQLRRTQAQAVVELRNLVAETKTAYYELARARELRSLSADLLKTTEEFDQRIHRLVEEGRRPGIETAQTTIEVARARQQLIQADGQITGAEALLNTLMGRPVEQPVGALAPLVYSSLGVSEQDLIGAALVNRAEIALEEAGAETFRQEARLSRAEGLPDLAPQFRAGTLTRGVSDTGFGIGITLPLDFGSRKHRVRQSEQSARAQSDRASAQRNLVRQEVVQAVSRIRAADGVLVSYPQGVIDQARRLLEASRIGLQEGQPNITVLNVLEAQRTYRTVQTEYTNALVAHAEARAELERAVGSVPATRLPEVRK